MDDQELQDALGGEMPADAAAAEPDATDPDGGLGELLAELDPSLAPETEPDEDAEDPDDAEDEDDPEALKRELAELRQSKRDAEARAAASENEQFWVRDRQDVETKLRQALDHLDDRMQQSATPDEVVREYLPRLIAGYTHDLQQHFAKREQAWEQVARTHGARTYRQDIQTQYRLSESAMDEIAAEFPPEQWHSAAKLHARTAAPFKQELDTANTRITKAERAVHARRLSQQLAPGPGRAAPISMSDALDRITEEKAPDQLLSVLRFSGVA